MKNKIEKNPFKLIGSYVGLLLGFIAVYFSFAIILDLAETGKFHSISLAIPLIPIILGFFAGYLIELLIKKLMRGEIRIHKNIGSGDWIVRFILLLVFIYLSLEISYWFFILVAWEIFILLTRWCVVYNLLEIDTLKNKINKN